MSAAAGAAGTAGPRPRPTPPGPRAHRAAQSRPAARQAVLRRLADMILAAEQPHPVRVAIDGVDAAGKTILADELAALLREGRVGIASPGSAATAGDGRRAAGSEGAATAGDGRCAAGAPVTAELGRAPAGTPARPVVRASIDGFHRPRMERYRRGSDSPEGYYLDSFDHESLRRVLLEPLGPGGGRRVRLAVYDFRADAPRTEEWTQVPEDAVLLFDGVFLLRPELNDLWDFRVFVSVGFDETLRRACERDLALFGSADATRERYLRRYIPGQRLYLRTVRPRRLADVVVRNRDPGRPRLLVRSHAR